MNIGIVLSGGMAKGAYQVGALKAISDHIPFEHIKSISGASVGVLNGCALATGNLEGAEALWRGYCTDERSHKITDVFSDNKFIDTVADLFDTDRLIGIDMYCTLLNINKKEVVYKNLKNVPQNIISDYLRASVAMPIYNKAVNIDGVSYFDGAMIDNIPVYPLISAELDYVICIYFDDTCYKFENSEFDSKVIKLTFPTTTRIKQSVIFSKDSIDSMLVEGYEVSKRTLESVFKKGIEDIDHIRKMIGENDANHNEKHLRITGDVLVTNLNKLTRRIANKKIVIN